MVVAEVEEDRLVVTERTKVFGLFMRILTALLLIDVEENGRWDLEDGQMHLTVTPSRCELTDIGGFHIGFSDPFIDPLLLPYPFYILRRNIVHRKIKVIRK